MKDHQVTQLEQGEDLEGTDASAFAGLLEESFAAASHKRGDIVKGVIVSKKAGEVLIDIGGKAEAVISRRELERMSDKEMAELEVGVELAACVLQPGNEEGTVVLSLQKARMEKDWAEAERLVESKEVIERPVVSFNKGGLIARIGEVRGFIPASHLSTESRRKMSARGNDNDESSLAVLVGETLSLKVIEVDRGRNRLILSEREAVKESRRQQKQELLNELEEGCTRSGVVSSICDFGVFVDLGGADGLVHISELSWERVQDPSQVVQVGDEVDVQVLKIDRERKRIGLSIKRLKPEPWAMVDDNYYVGQLVEGSITKLTDFGAFARLDNNVEGLIHISELSEQRIDHPRDVVQEGETVKLRVIRIDSARQRMGLSLRRAIDHTEAFDFEDDGEDTEF